MKKYRSVIAYIALSAVAILLFVLYVATDATGMGTGREMRPAVWHIPRAYESVLHISRAAILGVLIVIRARLCESFPTKTLKIVLPLACAAISVGLSFPLFFRYFDSYPYLWTVAAADVASAFATSERKSGRSAVAYVALSAVVILLFVLYFIANESNMGVGGLWWALWYLPSSFAPILHAVSFSLLGGMAVVCSQLRSGIANRALGIALPLAIAVVAVVLYFVLPYNSYYPHFLTLAAADVASIFTGSAKRRS